eukprot:CAMPEP_0202725838 /NCGR_PEP_ID=MMETSP1385-20130828/184305_1 /ASSEMBLY_ACC=CAM_ASM_000861 /TAXON_ID=933848 /ORGANISM="Elphidium margaritaceum" /LENGTH=730 /DNA_ID=CAMNT_0049392043 /DNA_START=130 /DNA_END=2322 /DNA_ORIENTATION=-
MSIDNMDGLDVPESVKTEDYTSESLQLRGLKRKLSVKPEPSKVCTDESAEFSSTTELFQEPARKKARLQDDVMMTNKTTQEIESKTDSIQPSNDAGTAAGVDVQEQENKEHQQQQPQQQPMMPPAHPSYGSIYPPHPPPPIWMPPTPQYFVPILPHPHPPSPFHPHHYAHGPPHSAPFFPHSPFMPHPPPYSYPRTVPTNTMCHTQPMSAPNKKSEKSRSKPSTTRRRKRGGAGAAGGASSTRSRNRKNKTTTSESSNTNDCVPDEIVNGATSTSDDNYSQHQNSNSNTSTNKNNHNQNNSNSSNSNNNNANDALIDKSPFKTTYVSDEEELELKNTNCTLYSQFHHARQAIYQQFTQKVEAIRHAALLSTEKRKLNIKIAAIDAKVQEKKLFLSYLEMSRPQPNSWLISNSALAMNGFARKIASAQQIPSVYTASSQQQNDNMVVVNNHDDDNGDANGDGDAHNQPESNNAQQQQNENRAHTMNLNVVCTNMSLPVLPPSATSKRIKKPKFSEFNVRVLRDWYETHTNNPYPSSNEKHLMCQLTGLTKYQVSRWFCNVRTRKPPPELSDNDEDIAGKTDHTPPPPPPPPNAMFSHPHSHSHSHSHPNALNDTDNTFNNIAGHSTSAAPPMPHTLSSVSPYNLPPITPLPMTPMPSNSVFNFNMGMSHLHRQQPQQQQQTKENLIDSTDHIEGLMPSIESKFNHQPTMNPPPLIDDENSNHSSGEKKCKK